ncbi:MAG: HAD-IIIA family hydrolase [Acidobacteria bacterium]|nr:HAD-IIIA family hydrolase [Acidobacteriota bacterium]
MMDIAERSRRIKLLILDVDGVLTDGGLYYGPSGEEIKVFHVRDGYGLKRWHDAGGRSAIISGRKSSIVETRARELGITFVYQDRDDKIAAFTALLGEAGLASEECCFVGDDSLDVPVLQQVGLAVAVADAHADAQAAAHHVTKLNGGRGAVREVTDLLLQRKG